MAAVREKWNCGSRTGKRTGRATRPQAGGMATYHRGLSLSTVEDKKSRAFRGRGRGSSEAGERCSNSGRPIRAASGTTNTRRAAHCALVLFCMVCRFACFPLDWVTNMEQAADLGCWSHSWCKSCETPRRPRTDRVSRNCSLSRSSLGASIDDYNPTPRWRSWCQQCCCVLPATLVHRRVQCNQELVVVAE